MRKHAEKPRHKRHPNDRFPAVDVSVARILSKAPATLALGREGALALLREHSGSVTRAVRAARQRSQTDPTVMQPVPEHGATYRNLGHAVNSCYVASTLAACFAQWDAWDALLAPAATGGSDSRVEHLRTVARSIVNTIRTSGAVQATDVDSFRRAAADLGFASGQGQEDPTELYLLLVDVLGAPMLPFNLNLIHEGTRDDTDERLELESIIPLSITKFANGDSPIFFDQLLDHYCFGNQLQGLRRTIRDRREVVNAWGIRLLLPEYTPQSGMQDRLRRDSFESIALPFCIKRYDSVGKKKRVPVALPVTVDFTKFVGATAAGSKYVLRLKSVVCHLGSSLRYGHYVTYTYDQTVWRRWDDMQKGKVKMSPEAPDEQPTDPDWQNELRHDSYIVFYELLPGDGTLHPGELLELSGSQHWNDENSEFVVELQETLSSPGMRVRYMTPGEQMQIENDEQLARGLVGELQEKMISPGMSDDHTTPGEQAQTENDEQLARSLVGEYMRPEEQMQIQNDAELARVISEEDRL